MSPSHPNRSRRKDALGRNPTAQEVAQLRDDMELTRAEFGALVHVSARTVEAWEQGLRRIHAGLWEYLCLLQAYEPVQQYQRMWREGRAF